MRMPEPRQESQPRPQDRKELNKAGIFDPAEMRRRAEEQQRGLDALAEKSGQRKAAEQPQIDLLRAQIQGEKQPIDPEKLKRSKEYVKTWVEAAGKSVFELKDGSVIAMDRSQADDDDFTDQYEIVGQLDLDEPGDREKVEKAHVENRLNQV